VMKPAWGINYITHERFRLPQLEEHVRMDGGSSSIGGYFTNMLDPSMTWNDVERMVAEWGGKFCLKGVMTAEDARHAADIGCAGIVLSNHGGRHLQKIYPDGEEEGLVLASSRKQNMSPTQRSP
jgi:L-lactate dehydrogenase (cytochrome)